MDRFTSIRSIHLSLYPLDFAKFFCLLISVHSLLILVIVFTDAFPAPPVQLYAYYSHFNFAMLGVAMLKDMPRQFYVRSVQIFLP